MTIILIIIRLELEITEKANFLILNFYHWTTYNMVGVRVILNSEHIVIRGGGNSNVYFDSCLVCIQVAFTNRGMMEVVAGGLAIEKEKNLTDFTCPNTLKTVQCSCRVQKSSGTHAWDVERSSKSFTRTHLVCLRLLLAVEFLF